MERLIVYILEGWDWVRHPIQNYHIWSFNRRLLKRVESGFDEREMPEEQEGTRKYPIEETPSEAAISSTGGWGGELNSDTGPSQFIEDMEIHAGLYKK